jgi:hypothetical protein
MDNLPLQRGERIELGKQNWKSILRNLLTGITPLILEKYQCKTMCNYTQSESTQNRDNVGHSMSLWIWEFIPFDESEN